MVKRIRRIMSYNMTTEMLVIIQKEKNNITMALALLITNHKHHSCCRDANFELMFFNVILFVNLYCLWLRIIANQRYQQYNTYNENMLDINTHRYTQRLIPNYHPRCVVLILGYNKLDRCRG